MVAFVENRVFASEAILRVREGLHVHIGHGSTGGLGAQFRSCVALACQCCLSIARLHVRACSPFLEVIVVAQRWVAQRFQYSFPGSFANGTTKTRG